ncbi:MAG: SapC family protein [Pseudomonadota bacterium]
MSETPEAPQVTGKMFLFDRPELMSVEQHGQLGVGKPEKRFGFCSAVRAIPVTISEIPAAMKDYPVIFMSAEQPAPLAVVGLIDDVNLFVGDDGEWEANRYIPGYIRRYPFGVASESGGERIAIVIDAGFDGLRKGGEAPLFDNGAPTQMTQSAIEFCKNFERDRQLTDEFVKQLAPYELITGQNAQFTPQGATEPTTFAQYFGIDEKKLNELPDDKFLELRRSGMLAIIYAMVISMGNWRLLLERRARRFSLTEAQITDRVLN